MKTREDAWQLLCEYTKSESLRRHALSVEACMRYYAEIHGQDPEEWAMVGLLHDLDYEKWPTMEEHTKQTMRILREAEWPDDTIRAVGSHYTEGTGLERQCPMEHALFAVDELSGFIAAVTFVRPSRNIADVEVKSVTKRMKEARFAAAVSREDIVKGAEELGIPLEEHVANCIEGMKRNAAELGLGG
jgi:putative nucleotidyltransferase with HDIG domain